MREAHVRGFDPQLEIFSCLCQLASRGYCGTAVKDDLTGHTYNHLLCCYVCTQMHPTSGDWRDGCASATLTCIGGFMCYSFTGSYFHSIVYIRKMVLST